MNAIAAPASPFPIEASPIEAQAAIRDEFAFFGDWSERYQYLIDLGRKLAHEDLTAFESQGRFIESRYKDGEDAIRSE